MAVPNSDLGQLIQTAIANGVGQAISGMVPSQFPPAGTAEIVGQANQATIGGSIAQSQYDAALAIFTDEHHSPGWGSDLLNSIMGFIESAKDAAIGLLFKGVELTVFAPLQSALSSGPSRPEDAYGNALVAFAWATSAGVVAHGLAGIASLQVVGCGQLALEHLAGFIGKMGDWDGIFSQTWGPVYRGYIGQPMRYYVNQQLRPFIPEARTLMTMRAKRILPGSTPAGSAPAAAQPFADGGVMPGYEEFRQLMAYHGYTDDWIKMFEDNLYTEPRRADIQIMADNDTIPESWWWEKARRLGYDERDAAYLVAGIQRRLARSYMDGLVSEITYAYREGMIADTEFTAQLSAARLSPTAKSYATQVASWKRYRTRVEAESDLLLSRFDRDQITVEELSAQLSMYYQDSSTVNQMTALAQVKKSRKVFWTTEKEAAKEALVYYRRLFVAGRITADEFVGRAVQAGVEPIVFDAMLDLDVFRRDQQIAAQFRQFGLPALRDLVLHGVLTTDQYRQELLASGFPDEYLDVEVYITNIKRQDRIAGQVRKDELSSYEQAYVVGLIGPSEMEEVMRLAGMDDYGVSARMLALDYQFERFQVKTDEALARQKDRSERQADREAEKRASEIEQARTRARAVLAGWTRETVVQAQSQTEKLAKDLMSEAQKGTKANADRLRALADQLADRLVWAKFQMVT
jgi:hypothetical protein